MTLGALGVTLGALWVTLDASGQLQFLERRMQQAVQWGCCLPSPESSCCLQVPGRDWELPKDSGVGGCKALYQVSALPLHSLGLVLPPYSTYYIQANLSDQILQVKCK